MPYIPPSSTANEISFDKKFSQSDCVFQLILGQQEHNSPHTWSFQQAF